MKKQSNAILTVLAVLLIFTLGMNPYEGRIPLAQAQDGGVLLGILADIPAPTQLPGEHSTLTTYDGSIRDDELADYICSQIPKDAHGNPQVHDVKIMFNSCYGGGMLDDFERIFGPGGACAGVPWVAGAASGPNQPAYGPSDETVDADPAANLGSRWTNALDDAVKAGGNVQSSFETARNNDAAGPNGYKKENPVVASGNNGSTVNWTDANDHHAVIFGGKNNAKRHDNNIENVMDALSEVWADESAYSMSMGWGDASTGTEAHLKDMIADQAGSLDADTQLVLYFDDHGDTDFDIDEFFHWLLPYIISPAGPTPVNFSLDPAYYEGLMAGLSAMDRQPLDDPAPMLTMLLTEPIQPGDWQVYFNEQLLPFPTSSEPIVGEVQLPVPWDSILPVNTISFVPSADTVTPLSIGNLELGSGPISEIFDIYYSYLPLVIAP